MKEGEPYLFMREGVSRQGRSAIGRGVAPSASRQIDLSSKANHDNVGFSHAHMLLLFAIFNKQYLLACTCHPPYPKRRGSYRQHLGGVMSKIKVAVFGLNQGARIARLFTSCGSCEEICPQHIAISEWLPKVDELLG